MNTFYGVWTPTSGALPDVKDLDFAAYYITESGSIQGSSTSYIKDNWLIYICEARGTLSERAYWRVTNGLVLFNSDEHKNVPDAGFYTKVRLDNAGNIVAGSDIEYDDLPQEVFDKFEKITDENLNKLIAAQLSTIFKNNTLNPIQLNYDSKTGKIGAELKLDEETIGVNELGQLCVIGGVEGGSSVSVEIDTTEITELKKKVTTLENEVARITPIEGNGINLQFTKGGVVYSVDIDENSLGFDADGKLCVNPDILSEYINDGEGGQCANHEHTASQIKDLEDFVKTIINNTSIYNTLVKNLSSLVDEETIIINEKGQLEAIATHVQKHQHVMNDITDLNQDIANVWASQQRLHASNDNQDFNKGAILMSSLTIGEVLIAFNELLKEYQEDIENFGKKVGTIEPVEPGLINTATFTDVSTKIDVFDTVTKETVKASKQAIIKTDDVIYLDGSTISVYIDNKLYETIKAYDDSSKTFGIGTIGNFNITYVGDAYPKFKTFQGYYKGFSFEYRVPALDEGIHTIFFVQENVNSGVSTPSDTITFNTIKDFTPACDFNIMEQPTPNGFVSGVSAFKGEPKLSVQVIAKNFNTRFSPVKDNNFECLGKKYTLEFDDISAGKTLYKPITIELDDYFGIIAFSASIIDWNSTYSTFEGQSDYINIDNSTEEAYRVVQESGVMTPIDNGTDAFSVYDPSTPLLDKYVEEAQVKDHKAILGKTNYKSLVIGPDYSTKSSPQMITLRFACPKMNNFYFDLEDDEGNKFNKNKDGSLKDIKIYAGIAPSNVVTRWVSLNEPYEGFGKWEAGTVFKALDLFRCEDKRVYATFGKDGDADEGYLYIKLILSGKAVNLQKLISSIEECLNERR